MDNKCMKSLFYYEIIILPGRALTTTTCNKYDIPPKLV